MRKEIFESDDEVRKFFVDIMENVEDSICFPGEILERSIVNTRKKGYVKKSPLEEKREKYYKSFVEVDKENEDSFNYITELEKALENK